MEKAPEIRQQLADTELQAALDAVTSKSEVELNAGNIAFLKARRSYLTGSQIAQYPSIFGEELQEDEDKDKPTDISLLIQGITDFNDLSTPQLTELGKALKIRGLHLYKDEAKLRSVVVEALEDYRKKADTQ